MAAIRKIGNREKGAGLVDVMVSCLIIGILAAIAVPTTVTSIYNMRLRTAATEFSGLVQRARIMAVNDNSTYTIQFGLPTGNGAYVDLSGDGSYESSLSTPVHNSYSEPMVQFGGTVAQVAAPGGASGKPTNLDASGGPLGWTATSGNLSFNSRGLPCNSSSTPCGTNVNYIFYFSDTRPGGANGWAAVSVTAAGHPKEWYWNGSTWVN